VHNLGLRAQDLSKSQGVQEIEALHRRCGVYTKSTVVRRILDAVGWRTDADLSSARLLEPACGDGAFVVEAARRLAAALAGRKIPLTVHQLRDRITAFELHPGEAQRARERVIESLLAAGVHHQTAFACAQAWVIEGDFLLSDLDTTPYTHSVGNPPYVRWARVPVGLRADYERIVPRTMVGGDLMLPFLDRALDSLSPGGRCGFICSDRWRYMAFAEAFRQKWLPQLTIHSERSVLAEEAFVQSVDSYPTILIASKKTSEPRSSARATVRKQKGDTLEDLGCIVRVGPALGHTPAFVLGPEEDDVEPELLHQWIDGSEIHEGSIAWKGRRVILMYGSDGKLLDPKLFPRLQTRLRGFRAQLKTRAIVQNGAPWYRTIDRVRGESWSRPKLLVPEIAKIPRVAVDLSGAVPSHGVYAIFACDDDVMSIYDKLKNGKLASALSYVAPKIGSNFVRCYKRFLMMARF
jgi:adenine-specific DNA-methyltransferase